MLAAIVSPTRERGQLPKIAGLMSDRRRPIRAVRDGRRNVARRHFSNAVAAEKTLQLVSLETNRRHTGDNRGDRGDGATTTNRGEHEVGRVAILRDWKALREH